MNTHQIDPISGEHPRALLQGIAFQLVRRTVDRPKADRAPIPGINESSVLCLDVTVLTSELFVQPPQVDPRVLGEGLAFGFEVKPTVVIERCRAVSRMEGGRNCRNRDKEKEGGKAEKPNVHTAMQASSGVVGQRELARNNPLIAFL
jgi:hypothetical protein